MKIQKRKSAQLNINITPLIDIVFLLLIFFMLTSTFIQNRSVQLTLPESEYGGDQKEKSLFITVLSDKKFLFKGEEFDKATLSKALLLEKSSDAKPPITLEIENNDTIQLFVSTMDFFKGLGYTDISLATKNS